MPPEPHAELESIAQMLSGQLRAGPDGRAMIECGLDISDPLAWAMEARRLLGARVRIYGFWAFENPEATVLEQIRERHDFAVIDKRWIVDLWFQRYHSSDNPPTVVDLENPAEMQRAAGFFGDPQSWERDMDMERPRRSLDRPRARTDDPRRSAIQGGFHG